MSALLEVADAIAAQLNSRVFRLPFTAVRSYADFDAAIDHDGLTVEVVPVENVPTELLTRGSVQYVCSADIVIRERLTFDASGQVKAQDVDDRVALIEELNEWLMMRQLDYDARWEATTIVAAVVHQHLREWNQFTGIIRIRYTLTRDLKHADV